MQHCYRSIDPTHCRTEKDVGIETCGLVTCMHPTVAKSGRTPTHPFWVCNLAFKGVAHPAELSVGAEQARQACKSFYSAQPCDGGRGAIDNLVSLGQSQDNDLLFAEAKARLSVSWRRACSCQGSLSFTAESLAWKSTSAQSAVHEDHSRQLLSGKATQLAA